MCTICCMGCTAKHKVHIWIMIDVDKMWKVMRFAMYIYLGNVFQVNLLYWMNKNSLDTVWHPVAENNVLIRLNFDTVCTFCVVERRMEPSYQFILKSILHKLTLSYTGRQIRSNDNSKNWCINYILEFINFELVYYLLWALDTSQTYFWLSMRHHTPTILIVYRIEIELARVLFVYSEMEKVQ